VEIQKNGEERTDTLKALKELGTKRAIKFLIGTILLILFRMMILPPLRVAFLRLLGATVGSNVTIHSVQFFNYYREGFNALKIGNNCFIGEDTLIDLADEVILHDDVTLAERVTILTHVNVGFKDHPLQRYFPSYSRKVVLRRGCFVGANATILPGVTAGECTFVGAGAVVREDIPAYHVVAGVPAQTIRVLEPQ
jgi:acetyltransferase-like isoleucine patch superfamily enzyme